jgi:hypothetical protein
VCRGFRILFISNFNFAKRHHSWRPSK